MEKSFSLIALDGSFCVLANAPVNTDSLWIRVIAFLFVLGLCAFFITRFNKKRLSVSAVRGDGKIRIADTCPLGNKQYLVIAQCDQEKFLLGVSPNGFHHITNLKNEDSEMKPSNEPKKPNSN